MNSKTRNENYRADIDGLRGIAIMLVMAYHAFPKWVPAGFVGVDIFFVISGFLISGILFNSLRSNKFSIFDFYGRRIRRLFPALIILFLALADFGWFAMSDAEYMQLGKHVFSASFFFANFTFLREQGYFDTAAITKPLIHLWSLSIEEQFYLVWPVVVWAVWKMRLNHLWPILALMLASFAYSAGDFFAAPAIFFMPQARIWELLFGALLAYLKFTHQPLVKSPSQIVSWAGFILIMATLLVITPEKPFSSVSILLPTVGTLLVLAGDEKSWFHARFLSNPLFVFIGLISYPLYLFHWPLLSLADTYGNSAVSGQMKTALLVLAILVAWLIYKFVEYPYRFLHVKKTDTIFLFLSLFAVGGVGYLINSNSGFPSRYEPGENDPSVRHYKTYVHPLFTGCEVFDPPRGDSCCSKIESPNVLLLGDSHVLQLLYSFRQGKNGNFNRASLINAVGFIPALGMETSLSAEKASLTILDLIRKNPSIQYVVIGNFSFSIQHQNQLYGERFIKGARDFMKSVGKLNRKVIWLIDTPVALGEPDPCAPIDLQLRRLLQKVPTYCHSTAKLKDLQPHNYKEIYEKLRAGLPNLYYYDPSKIFCDQNGDCGMYKGSKLMYSDGQHISIYATNMLVEDLTKELEAAKILKRQ